MDVLTIQWGFIGGKAAGTPVVVQEGATPVQYIRREPVQEDADDEIFMILLTEILLNE